MLTTQQLIDISQEGADAVEHYLLENHLYFRQPPLLRTIRALADIPQRTVAAELGFAKSCLSDWETGFRGARMPYEKFKVVAHFLAPHISVAIAEAHDEVLSIKAAFEA